MCGRTVCYLSTEELVHCTKVPLRDPSNVDKYRPSYNVAPTRYQPIITVNTSKLESKSNTKTTQSFISAKKMTIKSICDFPEGSQIYFMRWGLPIFSERQVINARSDSLISSTCKTSFNRFKHHTRCIILANGYYEWKTKDIEKHEEHKVPYFIHHLHKELIYFAGIFGYKSKEDMNLQRDPGYAIVTTDAYPKELWDIHHRMPFILSRKEDILLWLDPTKNWSEAHDALLQQSIYDESGHYAYQSISLEAYPVTSDVGKVGNEGSDLIVKIEPKKTKREEKGSEGPPSSPPAATAAVTDFFKKRKVHHHHH